MTTQPAVIAIEDPTPEPEAEAPRHPLPLMNSKRARGGDDEDRPSSKRTRLVVDDDAGEPVKGKREEPRALLVAAIRALTEKNTGGVPALGWVEKLTVDSAGAVVVQLRVAGARPPPGNAAGEWVSALRTARSVHVVQAGAGGCAFVEDLGRMIPTAASLTITAPCSVAVDLDLATAGTNLTAVRVEGGILNMPAARRYKWEKLTLRRCEIPNVEALRGAENLTFVEFDACTLAGAAIWAHFVWPSAVRELVASSLFFGPAPLPVPMRAESVSLVGCSGVQPSVFNNHATLKSLTLKNCGLTELGLDVELIPKLTRLVIDGNPITALPPGLLMQVTELSARKLALPDFPFELKVGPNVTKVELDMPDTHPIHSVHHLVAAMWTAPEYQHLHGGVSPKSFKAASALAILKFVTAACLM